MDEEFLFPLAQLQERRNRGRTFGLSPSIYSRLCWCGAMICDHSDVEPITIKGLPEPGCDLVFYGQKNAYTIRVTLKICSLSVLPLDAHTEEPALFEGESEWREDFDRIAQIILRHEGIEIFVEEDLRTLGIL